MGPLYRIKGYLWRHNRMMVWTLKEFKDVLLQVELEHRLLVALVSPAWVAQSSRIVRLMVELLVTQLGAEESPAGVEREGGG